MRVAPLVTGRWHPVRLYCQPNRWIKVFHRKNAIYCIVRSKMDGGARVRWPEAGDPPLVANIVRMPLGVEN